MLPSLGGSSRWVSTLKPAAPSALSGQVEQAGRSGSSRRSGRRFRRRPAGRRPRFRPRARGGSRRPDPRRFRRGLRPRWISSIRGCQSSSQTAPPPAGTGRSGRGRARRLRERAAHASTARGVWPSKRLRPSKAEQGADGVEKPAGAGRDRGIQAAAPASGAGSAAAGAESEALGELLEIRRRRRRGPGRARCAGRRGSPPRRPGSRNGRRRANRLARSVGTTG